MLEYGGSEPTSRPYIGRFEPGLLKVVIGLLVTIRRYWMLPTMRRDVA